MDPGPHEISIYPSFSEGNDKRLFFGWAFLMAARYIHASHVKGWRRSRRFNIHLLQESDEKIWLNGGIIHVRHPFDHTAYLSASHEEQQLIIREVIHQAMLRCSVLLNWPIEALNIAYQNTAIMATELVLESKLVRSPDKQHYASVVRVLNHQHTLITVRFRDRSKEIVNEVELITSFQDSYSYKALLGRLEWHSNRVFGVGVRSGELWITATIDEPTSTVKLLPTTSSAEELKGLLRRATYQEFDSKEDLVAWMNQ
jgi:hypothetical protein